MAKVKIQSVVEHLGSDFRKALRDTMKSLHSQVHFDEYALFREFRRQVGRKCNTWVNVPDSHIEE